MSHTQLKWDCEFALTAKKNETCSVTYGAVQYKQMQLHEWISVATGNSNLLAELEYPYSLF